LRTIYLVDEAIVQAESVENFRLALKARIANVDIFEDVDLAFWPGSRKAFARMDQERFADLLIGMLERFAGARMRKIEIVTVLNDDWLTVRITGKDECTCHPLSQSNRFFEKSLALSGGVLKTSFESNSPSVEIEFATFPEDV
jgi:hypothetical protein